MHAQAQHRRAGSAVAALATVLLLSAGPAAAAAGPSDGDDAPPGRSQDEAGPEPREGSRPTDRPPAHAGGGGDDPPQHAHSPAPEDRPPAHARARRASVQHGDEGDAAAPAPPARGGNAPPARSGGSPPVPAPDTEPGTGPGSELDTDVVDPDATRPLPERTPADLGSPVVVAVSAVPDAQPQPPAPTPSSFAPAPSGTPVAPVLPRDVAPGADPRPTPDILAAPPPSPPLEPFAVEDAARRVVVPVALLVAGLLYLLAQGRIDRGGLLLTAPEAIGSEHDDDVFEL